MAKPLIQETSSGLYCEVGDFYIDPARKVSKAIVTHAHADHARPGSRKYLAAKEGRRVLRHRLGPSAEIELLQRRVVPRAERRAVEPAARGAAPAIAGIGFGKLSRRRC